MKIIDLFEAAPVRKKVVRHGKVIIKKDCQPGYKLEGNTCVRQSSAERLARRRAAKRSARKGKAARIRNLKKSIKLRNRRGLNRN